MFLLISNVSWLKSMTWCITIDDYRHPPDVPFAEDQTQWVAENLGFLTHHKE